MSTSKTCVPVHVPASGDPTRVLGKVRRSLVSPLFSPVTLEFQREKAKELTKFFKQQSANALINDSTCAPKGSQTTELTFHTRTHACPPPRRSVFGWTKSNEINNGRWVMFGLLVGLMTELATGVVCSAFVAAPSDPHQSLTLRVPLPAGLPEPAEADGVGAGHRRRVRLEETQRWTRSNAKSGLLWK